MTASNQSAERGRAREERRKKYASLGFYLRYSELSEFGCAKLSLYPCCLVCLSCLLFKVGNLSDLSGWDNLLQSIHSFSSEFECEIQCYGLLWLIRHQFSLQKQINEMISIELNQNLFTLSRKDGTNQG